MKKHILFALLLSFVFISTACNKSDTINNTSEIDSFSTEDITQTQNDKVVTDTTQSTISGSFTVGVKYVIPDYCYDDKTPTIAVVTEFQSYPFTMFVGEEIGKQLEPGNVYVFTIKPMVVDYPKEDLMQLNLSSIVWEFSDFEITDFRLANEDELGMDSLTLTIE